MGIRCERTGTNEEWAYGNRIALGEVEDRKRREARGLVLSNVEQGNGRNEWNY
jgi:hypothetical protein